MPRQRVDRKRRRTNPRPSALPRKIAGGSSVMICMTGDAGELDLWTDLGSWLSEVPDAARAVRLQAEANGRMTVIITGPPPQPPGVRWDHIAYAAVMYRPEECLGLAVQQGVENLMRKLGRMQQHPRLTPHQARMVQQTLVKVALISAKELYLQMYGHPRTARALADGEFRIQKLAESMVTDYTAVGVAPLLAGSVEQ